MFNNTKLKSSLKEKKNSSSLIKVFIIGLIIALSIRWQSLFKQFLSKWMKNLIKQSIIINQYIIIIIKIILIIIILIIILIIIILIIIFIIIILIIIIIIIVTLIKMMKVWYLIKILLNWIKVE